MTGVRVYACDQLWKSITLGSNSRLDLEQCIIQDAKHAINAQKVLNVDINLQGNQFNDNYTGVFLDGVSLKNAIIGMKGNTFTLNALKSGTLPSVPEAPTGLYAASINQININ